MIYKILPLITFVLMSFTSIDNRTVSTLSDNIATSSIEMKIATVYNHLNANDFAMPKMESFSKALEGFYLLKEKGLIKKDILTLVDFSMSSNTKRLWIIDLNTNTILYNSLVAHGRNTGEEFANSFSNSPSSFKSSLGFYATGEIYNGKHGKSLRLDGLEKGINSNARERAVVIHGADYVSNSFIKNHNRLGRSQGCPAVPVELADEIINKIKDKSCLFIYFPSSNDRKNI